MDIDISERAGKVIAILVFGGIMAVYLMNLGSYEKLEECYNTQAKISGQCYESVRQCSIYKRVMTMAGYDVPFNISYPINETAVTENFGG